MSKYLLLSFIILILSCQWDLEDNANKNIPTYLNVLDNYSLDSTANAFVINTGENKYLTLVQLPNNKISLLSNEASLANDTWVISSKEEKFFIGTKLIDFKEYNNQYFILFLDEGQKTVLSVLSKKDFSQIAAFKDFVPFIDTFYNKVENIALEDMKIAKNGNILLVGSLQSFGRKYDMVLGLDSLIKPKFLRTYFKDTKNTAVAAYNGDLFAVINKKNNNVIELIIDDESGKRYNRIKLGLDQASEKEQLDYLNGTLVLTFSSKKNITSIITIDVTKQSLFVNDVQVYESKESILAEQFNGKLLVAGIIPKGYKSDAYLTEMNNSGSVWCNKFEDANFIKPLSITIDSKVGYLFTYLIKTDDNTFRMAFLKTDDEGATLLNPFDKYCQ
jgi:hypothetical protein